MDLTSKYVQFEPRTFTGDISLAFAFNTTSLLYADKEEYRAINCESYNFCNIKWFFEDVPYESWTIQTNPVTHYHLEDNNQTLVFESIDCDAEGLYRCEVSNGETTISHETNLVIEGKAWSIVWIMEQCDTHFQRPHFCLFMHFLNLRGSAEKFIVWLWFNGRILRNVVYFSTLSHLRAAAVHPLLPSVLQLGFPWYRNSHPDPRKKVLNWGYDLVIGLIVLPSMCFFHVKREQKLVRWCQIMIIWRAINQFKATVTHSSHSNHKLVSRSIVLVKQDSLRQYSS